MALVIKNLTANAGDLRDAGLIPGSGTSPGEGRGNSLQYSCLENPMDEGAWPAAVECVAKSRTQLRWLSMHTHRWAQRQPDEKEWEPCHTCTELWLAFPRGLSQVKSLGLSFLTCKMVFGSQALEMVCVKVLSSTSGLYWVLDKWQLIWSIMYSTDRMFSQTVKYFSKVWGRQL